MTTGLLRHPAFSCDTARLAFTICASLFFIYILKAKPGTCWLSCMLPKDAVPILIPKRLHFVCSVVIHVLFEIRRLGTGLIATP